MKYALDLTANCRRCSDSVNKATETIENEVLKENEARDTESTKSRVHARSFFFNYFYYFIVLEIIASSIQG